MLETLISEIAVSTELFSVLPVIQSGPCITFAAPDWIFESSKEKEKLIPDVKNI